MQIARIEEASGRVVYASRQQDGTLRRLEGDPLSGSVQETGEVVEVTKWRCPVDPPAIMCIGLNYAKHAAEGGMALPEHPMLFMKNPAAANGHEQPIRIPAVCSDEVDYECELAVVIGRPCRDVSAEKALEFVWGYTIANDVSARVLQLERGGGQWCRGKGFDTFAPMGPVVVTTDEITNPNQLDISTSLNGETMQSSNTEDMIFSVRELIAFLSQGTTLLPGTCIFTGTPSGIGWARDPRVTLQAGDRVAIQINGIGELTNCVENAEK